MIENPDLLTNIPVGWLLPEDQALPYNPFLTYPQVPREQRVVHVKDTPWLQQQDVLSLFGIVPDAIACYTGSIKQPRADEGGKLHPPLEGNTFPYGPASFARGEDPYRPDIQGTGGKVNVIGTTHLTEVLPHTVPVYTFATFSNDRERQLYHEQGMPTAARIYEWELREKHHVINPIIPVDQFDIENSLEMVMATILEAAKDPNIRNMAVLTERYHIPRCTAFLEVCGMGADGQIQEWIFNNWKLRSGKDILTPEFRQAVAELHERGARLVIKGGEDVMAAVDARKIEAGVTPRYRSVLRLVYPPKLSENQFRAMEPQDQQEWLTRIANLQVRLDTEANGVRQLKEHTYWAPKPA
jgi:hypothetical protein